MEETKTCCLNMGDGSNKEERKLLRKCNVDSYRRGRGRGGKALCFLSLLLESKICPWNFQNCLRLFFIQFSINVKVVLKINIGICITFTNYTLQITFRTVF